MINIFFFLYFPAFTLIKQFFFNIKFKGYLYVSTAKCVDSIFFEYLQIIEFDSVSLTNIDYGFLQFSYSNYKYSKCKLKFRDVK